MVRPTTALGDAAEIMLETDRGTLPVVDGELVGYVCFSDILKLIQGAYGEEEEEAEEEPFDPHNYIV
jgi:CBS domain-containing protein